MKITKDNYEIWFLDYLEERLDKAGQEEVRSFLVSHPGLAAELEDFAPMVAVGELLAFPGKEHLKRIAYQDPSILETTVIAAMEGDLTQEETHSFEAWLEKNPAQQLLVRQIQNTRLHPNPGIIFPGRKGLKKSTAVRFLWTRIAAVAAAIVLALLLFDQSGKRREPIASVPLQTAPEQTRRLQNGLEATAMEATPAAAKPKHSVGSSMPLTTKKFAKHENSIVSVVPRVPIFMAKLESRSVQVTTYLGDYTEPILLKSQISGTFASNQIPLSDFYRNKLDSMKAGRPKFFFSREEVIVAGLHLFSRLPGRHLTGKEDANGRLTSIDFNTQLLAFSIPLNR